LIDAGTRAATDETAAGVVVVFAPALVVVFVVVLLLPHAAIAAMHATETGIASQRLNEYIKGSFPRRRRQHKRQIES
jgi:hypothetical protein